MPALRARVCLTPSLKDTGRSRAPLLVPPEQIAGGAQVAMSLLLLITPAFPAHVCTTCRLYLWDSIAITCSCSASTQTCWLQDAALANLYRQMFDRVESVPGVSAVHSRANACSQAHQRSRGFLGSASSADSVPRQGGEVVCHHVRENFFATMEIPLLLGRSFTPQDPNAA